MKYKTGEVNVINGKRKSLIAFCCSDCGRRQIGEYEFEYSVSTLIGFWGNNTKEEEKSRKIIFEKLEEIDNTTRTAFNDNEDYLVIEKPVLCCECGSIQPWSDMTENYKKKNVGRQRDSFSFVFTLIVLFGLCFLADVRMGLVMVTLGGIILATCKGVAISQGRKTNRIIQDNIKIRQEHINLFRASGTEKPIYYRRQDVKDLLEGPYREVAIGEFINNQ